MTAHSAVGSQLSVVQHGHCPRLSREQKRLLVNVSGHTFNPLAPPICAARCERKSPPMSAWREKVEGGNHVFCFPSAETRLAISQRRVLLLQSSAAAFVTHRLSGGRPRGSVFPSTRFHEAEGRAKTSEKHGGRPDASVGSQRKQTDILPSLIRFSR